MKKYQKWILITLAIVMVMSLLTGCGSKPASENKDTNPSETTQNNDTNPSETAPAEAEAVENDTLRVAMTSEPPSLSIYDHSSLLSVLMNTQMYNGLMRIDYTTLEPVCDLAESYEVANDVEWTFQLKKGVKFHNGEEMTSADVVASLEYAKSLPAATLYTASMEKIEAVDEYTVKITTTEPYAGLLCDLAYYYNFIVPKSLIDEGNDFNANPVGTGPYKLKEWSLGNYISLERHDDYFNEEHIAKIKNLIFSIVPEGTSRTVALKSGDVDFVWEVNSADIASLQTNEQITVAEVPSVEAVIMFFNNDKAPFDDANLRNAIASAINREDIIAAALNGYGNVNYSCIAQGFAESTDTNAIPFDLDAAKAYLDAWGGDPASVDLKLICSNETRVAIGTVIQSNLAQIGINVEVVQMDTAAALNAWKTGEFIATMGSWSPSNALSYVQRFHSDRRQTYAGAINDPELDALVNEAKGTLDAQKRAEIIDEIIGIVNSVSPQVTLYQSTWYRAYAKGLEGVLCSATGYVDFCDVYWAN